MPRRPSIAEEFARHSARLKSSTVPDPVLAHAKRLLLDFCGNALGGSRTESFRLAASALNHIPDGGFTVVGHRPLALPEYAALLNGLAAHSLETDDIQNESSVHMGAVVLPVVLAAADLAPVSGIDAVRAMLAGYEVLGRIGRSLGPKAHYGRGFHPTATCGPYGAAMAAAFLLQLTEDQTANALGIASIGSAGLLEFLADGSLTKRLHPGWAAHAGLTAALLARADYTGPRTVFEGKKGFLRAYSDHPNVDLARGPWEPLGRELINTSLKPHACCRYNQSAIDGVLELVTTHDLAPADIAAIRIGVLSVAWELVAAPIAEKRNPHSIVDAQFSLPFAMAVAALRRRASPEEYSPTVIADSEVKDMMERVTCFREPSLDLLYPEKWPAVVEIDDRSGRTYRLRVDHPKGDPENPLTWEETEAKFHAIAASTSAGTRSDIAQLVASLEELPDMRVLPRALSRAPVASEVEH